MTSLRLYLGGPAYKLELDARHAQCVAHAVGELVRAGHGLEELDYEHTSILPQGRARWLQRAMRSRADIAIGLDSDTYVKDGRLLVRAAEMLFARGGPWSLVGGLVPQRNGVVNAWEALGLRLSARPEPFRPHPCWAVGAALCFYNLHWYRARELAGELVWRAYSMIPTGDSDAFMGEDAIHCLAVANAGGVVECMAIDGVCHAGGL